MTGLAYHLAWMGLGLLLAAGLSAWLVARVGQHARREAQARGLLSALRLYALWLAAQRSGLGGAVERASVAAALRRAQACAGPLGPRVARAVADLAQADDAIERLSHRQRSLRRDDPEAWLDSDHEAQLAALRQRQEAALQAAQALALSNRRAIHSSDIV
ncbi:hypothetical protein ACT80S_04260 [Ramlibacter sp. MAHUQ-53]|uniref:hypothetical protein n=1 Tax=unclassified Ramlibacter TaxID=2617605 RepID=UPI003638C960